MGARGLRPGRPVRGVLRRYEAAAQAILAADPSLSWDEVDARLAAAEEAAQELDVGEQIARADPISAA